MVDILVQDYGRRWITVLGCESLQAQWNRRLGLGPDCRQDAEAAAGVDSVGFEIGVVDGEYGGKRLAFG